MSTHAHSLRQSAGWHLRHRRDRLLPRVIAGPRHASRVPPVLAHNGYSRARSLSDLLGWTPREVIRKLYVPGDPTTVSVNGDPITLRPGTSDPATLDDTFNGGFHRPPTSLPVSPLIVDLGANIGLTLLDYARRFPDATLVGVELDAGNADLARRNTAVATDCTVLQGGIVGAPREYVNYQAPATVNHHGYSVGQGDLKAPAITMEELLSHVPDRPIDLLKMDIEGAERELLESPAAASWAKRVKLLMIEIHKPWSTKECEAALGALGFESQRDTRVAYAKGLIAHRA
jgi:FkbM family methyltransferase